VEIKIIKKNIMGLSQATMNAIARAQKATSISTASVGTKAFADSYEKAYSEQVEKLAKEEERKEEAKMNSLDHLDEMTELGSKLGKFKDIGETVLKSAKDEVYKTYDLTSTFDQTIAQREVMNQVKKDLEPYGVANQLVQSAISSVSQGTLDTSMKAQVNFAGTDYNKYQIMQGLGEGHSVSKDGKILNTVVKDEEGNTYDAELLVADLGKDEYKISTINPATQKTLENDITLFVATAQKQNFDEKKVTSMVQNYVLEKTEADAKSWVYNYFNENPTDEDIKSPPEEGKSHFKQRLEARMLATIMLRAPYEAPEVDEPEVEEVDEPTPRELEYKSGKALYDDQINTIRAMRLPPESSPKGYYKSAQFEKDLPTNFVVEKTGEGDDMEIDIYNSDESTESGESRRMISVTNQSLKRLKEQLEGRVVGRQKYFEKYID
jgi:hypothetical protein